MGLSALAPSRHREQVISRVIKSAWGLFLAWPHSNQVAESRCKIKEESKCSAMAGSEGYEHQEESNVAEKLTGLS